jgi:Tol biopolymer transport system component
MPLGYFMKKQLPGASPKDLSAAMTLLIAMQVLNRSQLFSFDGKSIIYVTWSDSASGAIYKINAQGSGKPVKITAAKGIYRQPSFSPDGKWIVFSKRRRQRCDGFRLHRQTRCLYHGSRWQQRKFCYRKGEMPRF